MADKNDGKPGDGAAGKRPTPLLDLKATEVTSSATGRGGKPGDPSTQTEPTSGVKGAADGNQPPRDAKPGASVPPAGTQGAAGGAAGSTAGGKPTAAAGGGASGAATAASGGPGASTTARNVPGSPGTTAGSAAANGGAAGAGSTTGATSSGASPRPAAGAATAAGAKPQPAGAAAAGRPKGETGSPHTQPASARSGGGFFSALTHLAAGVIGGGIVLTAAGPIGNELGLGLTPKNEVPAAIQQRLAALETRPNTGGAEPEVKNAVAQLSAKLAATERKIGEIDVLGKQVAALADDLKGVQQARNAGAPPTSPSGAAGAVETVAISARLAKLENVLATLSSAANSGGNASGIAPLAQFSGKIADLESALATQIGTLRKSLTAEMDNRIAGAQEATAKAVASAERLEREVSEIKTEAARLEQRSTVLKTASDKLAATVRAVGEQAAELKVDVDAHKGAVSQELAKVARPGDVSKAIAPVSQKLAAIEKDVGALVSSEAARKNNAERIVLSLELSSLKRVLDRGQPYAAELVDVKKIAGGAVDFTALDAHKDKGVPSGQELTRQFRNVAYQIINAEAAPAEDASRIDKLLAAAKSIVKVRRTDTPADEKTAEAAVARIEKQLKTGDMSGALALAEQLPAKSKAPAQAWMSKLAARANVDRAIAKLEDQLKASLGTGPQADKKS